MFFVWCSSSKFYTTSIKRSTPKRCASFYGGGQEIPRFVVPEKIIGCICTILDFFDHCTIVVLPLSATGGGRTQCPHLRCSSSKFYTTSINRSTPKRCASFYGGGQEIRTLAPVSRPTPLAGEPLWPLE